MEPGPDIGHIYVDLHCNHFSLHIKVIHTVQEFGLITQASHETFWYSTQYSTTVKMETLCSGC